MSLMREKNAEMSFAISTKFSHLGALVSIPLYQPVVYAYVSNFVSLGFCCRSLAAKTPNFAVLEFGIL